MDKKHYRNYPEDVLYSDEYMDHVSAMTREELHSKSDIACELAYRDLIIKGFRAEKKELENALRRAVILANGMTEIDEFNYDHDDVYRLNSESIELYEVLQNAYDKLIGKAVQND